MVEEGIPSVPGRSFFTETQREYLFGEEFENNRERQIRFQMRKNLQSALIDLQLIWNFSQKDRYLATLPLSAFYEFEGIAPWVLEKSDTNLKELTGVDVSGADEQVGGLMHQGIADLLTLYASWYGPKACEKLVDQALRQAAIKEALERDSDIGAYEVDINHIGSVSDFVDQLE